MSQILVIREEFYNSLSKDINLAMINKHGYKTANDCINGIIKTLNEEFHFFEIDSYRFPHTKEEASQISQYGGFVTGEDLEYKRVIVFFTPIDSKLGNVIIEQSLMPTICNQMESDITFLLDERIKKIVLLTSHINAYNVVPTDYNKLQMDINSLNTLNIDVIPFFPIKNLSTDTKFNTLTEYLEMSEFLQKKNSSNAQYKFLDVKGNVLYGDCTLNDLKGEFYKSFSFRFLTAILAGGNEYKYDISKITNMLHDKLDNQFANLKRFIEYANKNVIKQSHFVVPVDEDIVESDDDIVDVNDIHRLPEKGLDNNGRKRYKTQKKVRDEVLKKSEYLCNCHDLKHFYFESTELNNYVEGHHVVPMNRQEEYYFSKNNVNLDIQQNIVAMCPNCHSQIHLGSRIARLKILSELFVRNKVKLITFDESITLAILASYYNIGLEKEEEKDWLKRADKIVSEKYKQLI